MSEFWTVVTAKMLKVKVFVQRMNVILSFGKVSECAPDIRTCISRINISEDCGFLAIDKVGKCCKKLECRVD